MQRILLVEDHASFRQTLAFIFEQEPDFEVVAQAGSVAEARREMSGLKADVGVIDLSLPDGEGTDLYLVHKDGTEDPLQLTIGEGDYKHPAWQPAVSP